MSSLKISGIGYIILMIMIASPISSDQSHTYTSIPPQRPVGLIYPYRNMSDLFVYSEQQIDQSRVSSVTATSQPLTPPTLIELPAWEERPLSSTEAEEKVANSPSRRSWRPSIIYNKRRSGI